MIFGFMIFRLLENEIVSLLKICFPQQKGGGEETDHKIYIYQKLSEKYPWMSVTLVKYRKVNFTQSSFLLDVFHVFKIIHNGTKSRKASDF